MWQITRASVQAIVFSYLLKAWNEHEWTSEGILFQPRKDIITHNVSSLSPLKLIYSPVWFVCRTKCWILHYDRSECQSSSLRRFNYTRWLCIYSLLVYEMQTNTHLLPAASCTLCIFFFFCMSNKVSANIMKALSSGHMLSPDERCDERHGNTLHTSREELQRSTVDRNTQATKRDFYIRQCMLFNPDNPALLLNWHKTLRVK